MKHAATLIASDATRRRRLRSFLMDARRRIDPARFGFGTVKRRRVPGLRREELADLLGVSETWYARCEAGNAFFSLGLLSQLAKVLGMDESERVMLFRLARPESDRFTYRSIMDDVSGLIANRFRSSLYELRRATSIDDAARAVCPFLASLRSETALGYVAARFETTSLRFLDAAGRRADDLSGKVRPQMHDEPVHRSLREGATVIIESLEESGRECLRNAAREFGVASSLLVPVRIDGRDWSYVLGALFADREPARSYEIAMVEALAALTEATFSRVTDSP